MGIILCPKCNVEFNNVTKWGTKKFCSRKCANSRTYTDDLKQKISNKLSIPCKCESCGKDFSSKIGLKSHIRYCPSSSTRILGTFFNKNHTDDVKKRIGKHNSMGTRVPASLLDMSSRTSSKIMKPMGLGCFNCGWDMATCDIHHIVPKNKGGSDENTNLTYICPNCHRLAHENKLTCFISITEKIGEEWRNYYFAHE